MLDGTEALSFQLGVLEASLASLERMMRDATLRIVAEAALN